MTGVVKIRLSLVIKFALTKPSGKIFSTTSCDCPGSFSGKLTVSLKWTQLSRQKIIVFLTRLKKNFDYLMVTFPAFPPE